MTTTMPAMLETIKAIKENKKLKNTKIFIGGAVVKKKIPWPKDGKYVLKIGGRCMYSCKLDILTVKDKNMDKQ